MTNVAASQLRHHIHYRHVLLRPRTINTASLAPAPVINLPLTTFLRLLHCSVRMRLTKLKKDRTEYIRAKDVLDIYAALMQQGARSSLLRATNDTWTLTCFFHAFTVSKLNELRAPTTPTASTSSVAQQPSAEVHEENRVDNVLNDVFSVRQLCLTPT